MKSEQLRKGFALTPKNKKAGVRLLPLNVYTVFLCLLFLGKNDVNENTEDKSGCD